MPTRWDAQSLAKAQASKSVDGSPRPNFGCRFGHATLPMSESTAKVRGGAKRRVSGRLGGPATPWAAPPGRPLVVLRR